MDVSETVATTEKRGETYHVAVTHTRSELSVSGTGQDCKALYKRLLGELSAKHAEHMRQTEAEHDEDPREVAREALDVEQPRDPD